MKQTTQYIVKGRTGYVLDPNDLETTPDVTLSARMDLPTAQRVRVQMNGDGLSTVIEPVQVEDYSSHDYLICSCGDNQIFIAGVDFENLQESPVVWLGRLERLVMRRIMRRLNCEVMK